MDPPRPPASPYRAKRSPQCWGEMGSSSLYISRSSPPVFSEPSRSVPLQRRGVRQGGVGSAKPPNTRCFLLAPDGSDPEIRKMGAVLRVSPTHPPAPSQEGEPRTEPTHEDRRWRRRLKTFYQSRRRSGRLPLRWLLRFNRGGYLPPSINCRCKRVRVGNGAFCNFTP